MITLPEAVVLGWGLLALAAVTTLCRCGLSPAVAGIYEEDNP